VSAADHLAAALSNVPDLSIDIIGIYRGAEDELAIVDVGQARITIPSIGPALPFPGEEVRLLRAGTIVICLGPVSRRSPIGKVVSSTATFCNVEYPPGSGVTQQMGYPKGSNPAPGDAVLIDWLSGGVVATVLTAAPTPPAPPPPHPAPPAAQQTMVFTATGSGTYDPQTGSWARTEVWSEQQGAWFYGTKIADTIPDTATIRRVEIYTPLLTGGGTATIACHTSTIKPTTAVAAVGASTTVTVGGWVRLPTGIGVFLQTNTGGIAISGGTAHLRGVDTDGQSGALKIIYQ